MAAPFSQDSQRRLVGAISQGSSAAAVRIVLQARETGSTAPATDIGGYRKPLLAGHEAVPRELVGKRKGITLTEIRDELTCRAIRSGALSRIWTTLRRLGLSHEKGAEDGCAGPPRRRRAS